MSLAVVLQVGSPIVLLLLFIAGGEGRFATELRVKLLELTSTVKHIAVHQKHTVLSLTLAEPSLGVFSQLRADYLVEKLFVGVLALFVSPFSFFSLLFNYRRLCFFGLAFGGTV